MKNSLNKIKVKTNTANKYLIIGYGKFGRGFALRLLKEGVKESKIYIVDKEEATLEDAKSSFSNVMATQVTDFEILDGIDINEINIVVIAMSDLESSLMIAANCVKYPNKKFMAKAKNEIHLKLLKTLGVDDVVIPEEELGSRLAYRSLFKGNLDIFDIDDLYCIIHIKLDNLKNIENKTLAQLNLRAVFECNIFGIKRDNQFFIPSADVILKTNDIISVICRKDMSKNLLAFFHK
ncbi:MAG: TrkA family potassium uptake protein [Malacoplasma sp.]|nr:TrkA family potassium uptake protein [Malacoplasma sp.]